MRALVDVAGVARRRFDVIEVLELRMNASGQPHHRGHFASWTGTAPADASSGDHVRHRLSRGGNRQINRVLHTMAVVQLRNPTEGRAYFNRKKAAGKTANESMRCLNRRLSDLVHKTMLKDLVTPQKAGPGGQQGNDSDCSATGSHPNAGSSDKPLPGPATTHPRTHSRLRLDTEGSQDRADRGRSGRVIAASRPWGCTRRDVVVAQIRMVSLWLRNAPGPRAFLNI